MITMRRSSDSDWNRKGLLALPSTPGETNTQWLRRAGETQGILLLGGASLADFRARVAQSHLRSDLMPSFWSFAGILEGGEIVHAAPFSYPDAAKVPVENGIRRLTMSEFDDPKWFPNIAVLHFAKPSTPLLPHIERLKRERAIVDLPALALPWLGFLWGVGQYGNPLLSGTGMPSAAFVEAVHALARIELTPGLSSSASCPEALWTSAKWWHGYYATTDDEKSSVRLRTPSGVFATRQRSAAIFDPNDPGEGASDSPKSPAPKRSPARKAARKSARRR